ncbi:hypothetical protein [uncultured Erythrobacter sp.]|uniref:hypothetical protein n=1 Tax=uncultured Erythrobacter sp. TaxID=263913 RepID=UPI0026288F83|nr:hypothetical protein [uncultured Erythrobacter sp.]
MKKLATILVAAALITPVAVSASAAHKVNTPGTQARHEMNLAVNNETVGNTIIVERSREEARQARTKRARSALAGKVNVAARSRT